MESSSKFSSAPDELPIYRLAPRLFAVGLAAGIFFVSAGIFVFQPISSMTFAGIFIFIGLGMSIYIDRRGRQNKSQPSLHEALVVLATLGAIGYVLVYLSTRELSALISAGLLTAVLVVVAVSVFRKE